MLSHQPAKSILFLQGPLSDYFSQIASFLKAEGHQVHRINFCGNDRIDWHHDGAEDFTDPPSSWEDFLSSFLDRTEVNAIVLHGDRRFYHQIASKVARERGIEVYATELGYLRPDYMTIEKSACSACSHFPTDPAAIFEIAAKVPEVRNGTIYSGSMLSQVMQELRFTFFNTLFHRSFPHYLNHRLERWTTVYAGWLQGQLSKKRRAKEALKRQNTLIGANEKYYLVALQLEGDFQIRDHSPFNGMGDAIKYIAQSFARCAPKDAKLILKTHPLEFRRAKLRDAVEAISQELEIPARLELIDGGDLTSLCKNSQGFVTVNSSAGLDALKAGTPTMAVMPTIYDVPGLTFQGSLNNFWAMGTRPDPTLFAAFVRALAGTIQVRGTLYNKAGRRQAAKETAAKISMGTVNSPGAFIPIPPRLHKAEKNGVTYPLASQRVSV
ncbi:capsular biosynthesis protein [Pseudovibrio exalbescens]|uniref:capsule biosynthesis protein n=1 Tax=Pseudovibrio exalbescens TaxID=197461 RepID=UPI00236566C9|nr:capsular biosynthesis protein [Pseudovibrio exalbescens]MDD7911619.1 capsular biosynthesis protein [Pseudovibrio exalbescens]